MADTPDGFLFEHRVLDVWAIHAAIPVAVGEHYLGILKRQCESDPGAWRLVPYARLGAGETLSLDEFCERFADENPPRVPNAETAAVLRAVWTLCNNTEGGSRPARGREVERLSEALTDWECEHGDIHGPHGWNLPAKDDEGAEPDSWSFDPPDRVGGES